MQLKLAILIPLFVFCPAVTAHHNFNAIFDMQNYEVVEVTVERIRWVNPHTIIMGKDNAGKTWKLETGPVNILTRAGIERKSLKAGDRISVRGNPARSGKPLLWLRNLLTPDGSEVLLANGTPFFEAEKKVGVGTKFAFGDVQREDDEVTFFRTWAVVAGSDMRYSPKYNNAAKEVQKSYVRPPGANCMPPGLPRAFNQRHPIQLVDNGDYILIRGEEFDAERKVWLNPPDEAPGPSLYGYGLAHIKENVLTIESTNIDYPRFLVEGPYEGMPMGKHVKVVETYTLADEGLLLNYKSTMFDEEFLAEPYTFTQTYHQQPSIKILPWACTNE